MKMKTCTACERTRPISYFASGRNVCHQCYHNPPMKDLAAPQKVTVGRRQKTLIRLQTLIEPAQKMAREALALHGCTEEQIEQEMKSEYTEATVSLLLVKLNNYAERVAKGKQAPRY